MTRTEEKQASRDADAKALATGEKTREDLWRENSFVPAEIARTPIDFSRITCQVCGKAYEYAPRGDGGPHPYQDEVMGYCGDPPPTKKARVRPLRLPKR